MAQLRRLYSKCSLVILLKRIYLDFSHNSMPLSFILLRLFHSYSIFVLLFFCLSLAYHHFLHCSSSSDSQESWSLSYLAKRDRSSTPCTDRRLTHRARLPFRHTFLPRVYFESPSNLACIILNCERKMEEQEKTHTSTGGTRPVTGTKR